MITRAKILTLCGLLLNSPLALGADFFVLEGRLTESGGLVPVEASQVDFTIEVLSPDASSCKLYRETHSINMSGTRGYFNLKVGNGDRSGVDFEDTSSLMNIMNNGETFTGLNCNSGTSYAAIQGDSRKVRITYDAGEGPQTLSQTIDMGSAPFAHSAKSIDGINATELLTARTDGGLQLTQANLETVFSDTNYDELLLLLSGNSTSFNSGGSIEADFNLNNNRITNLTPPTDPNDATNKNYVDTNIGGQQVDPALATIGAGEMGQVLTWSGTQWQTQTVVDPTKLPLDGTAPMTGNLFMGGNDITGIQNLGVNNDATVSNDLSVGNDLSVDENVLVGGGIGVATGISSDGNVSIYQQQALQLTPETSTGSNNYVGFKAPAALSGTQIWTLPQQDGAAGTVLSTDGSGNLNWSAAITEGSDILAGNGTSDKPSLSFLENQGTGFYSPGMNLMGLSTNGVERVRINQDGFIGVGVSSPAAYLDVAGAIKIGNDMTACSAPMAGALRYEGGNVEYCNGTTWAAFGTSSSTGTVTEVATGTGLTGGPITENGTISIAAGGVTNNELAADAVASINLQNMAVTNEKIQDGAITGGKLATNSITVDKIDDNAVSSEKIQSLSADKLTGFIPAARLNFGDGTGSVAAGDDPRFGNATKIHGNVISDSWMPSSSDFLMFDGMEWRPEPLSLNNYFMMPLQAHNSGSAVNPSYSFSNANNTGMFLDFTTKRLAFSTNTFERLSITEGGNVGIGTTAPMARLDVDGAIRPGAGGACDANTEGSIRRESGNLELCQGGEWTQLVAKKLCQSVDTTTTANMYGDTCIHLSDNSLPSMNYANGSTWCQNTVPGSRLCSVAVLSAAQVSGNINIGMQDIMSGDVVLSGTGGNFGAAVVNSSGVVSNVILNEQNQRVACCY